MVNELNVFSTFVVILTTQSTLGTLTHTHTDRLANCPGAEVIHMNLRRTRDICRNIYNIPAN